MKIALVSSYDYLYPGGVNNHIAHLLRYFRQWGNDAHVIATVPAGKPVPPHTIPLNGRLVTLKSGGAMSRINMGPSVIRQIRGLLQRYQFDIVHLHNPLSPLVNPAFLVNRAVAPVTAFIATFHEQRSTPNRAIELGKPLFRRWINRLDGRIVVSEAALNFNQPLFPGEYTLIPNGVDVARFASPHDRATRPQPHQTPTILFVGRLETRKGFTYLLQAFKQVKVQLPAARLQMVGPYQPDVFAEITAYINRHHLTGIELVGQVSDEALPGFYQSADVFCAPSIDFESFGIVLLEAMAAALPVVASDIPGYRSVVQPGRHGLLVEPKNPAALAEALVKLLQDPRQREKMGRAGQLHVRSFNWKIIAGSVLNYYAQILGRSIRASKGGF